MEELLNKLAHLVAMEARAPDLVDPDRVLSTATRAVVKASVVVIEDLHGRIAALEDQVKAMSTPTEAPPPAPVEPEPLPVVVTPGPVEPSTLPVTITPGPIVEQPLNETPGS